MNIIILQQDTPYKLDHQLTITVISIGEEWLAPDRRSVMSISLKMEISGRVENVHFTSEEPELHWNGYLFVYQGGWREEVRLSQIITKK